uniref:SPK domain-containing protein n=1 Tax=Caenorhabditis japonica TaxID=281687 RepID=A0A8R1E0U0_CAEJA
MPASIFNDKDDEILMKYVTEKTTAPTATFRRPRTFWEDCSKICFKSMKSPGMLSRRFRYLSTVKLHELKNIDLESKVRMLLASRHPINEEMLKELQQDAEIVELNERRVLIRYKKGDFELGSDRKYEVFFTRKEDMDLLNFIAKKAKSALSPIPKLDLFDEYVRLHNPIRTSYSLCHRFRYKLAREIQEMDGLDIEIKLRMLFITSYHPLDEQFIQGYAFF